MEQLQGEGNVTVHNANSSNGALQFIGYTKIDTLNYGATGEEKAHRQFNAILRWLSPSTEALKLQSFIDEESRANHKLENTGLWFLRSELFKGCLEGSSRLTWVNGGSKCLARPSSGSWRHAKINKLLSGLWEDSSFLLGRRENPRDLPRR
jgi:hypothetical protein